jgi:hypothetical protein
MLKRGLDTDAIMEMTGLSKDELQSLRNKPYSRPGLPGGNNLARNNQVDAETREQRAGKTVNPLRQALIATTHLRQRKRLATTVNHASFHDNQGKNPPTRTRSTLSPTNNEKTEPK